MDDLDPTTASSTNQPAAPLAAPTASPAPTPSTVAGTTYSSTSHGPSFLVRCIYFLLVGWWLAAITMTIGWLMCISIVLLPLGLVLLNMTPTILTLRPRPVHTTTTVRDGVVQVVHANTPQRPFLVRAIYFLLVGWWFTALWMAVAWLIGLTIVGIPIELMMLNRIPEVLTLRRN